MSALSVIMEPQFNFDLNFDFLDATTSVSKPNDTISTSYTPTADLQVLDVETLATKIASVNDLVLQLKSEKDAHAKLQKQMQDLSESAMSIRRLYEQEKAEKAKYALLSQELKEKCEAAESQLTNKTLHFEQLTSKIEQAEEKGPIPYNELILRYHRLALHLDEDKDLNHKERQRLQQIQEYMVAKKLSTLTPFRKKKKQSNGSVHKDQGTQHYAEMESKSTFTDFEVMQKKFVSQSTQHTSYTTTRGTNTESQNVRKEMKTQGTQYISSTTTRSTSTSGFIKTRSVGTNFPDESTNLVEDIFNEMIFDIVPLSPLAEEELTPLEQVEMKTVGTITGLQNIRKPIDYVTPVSIKSSDSRPPSRNMFERVKNEVPFTGAPNMNSFVEHGANSSSVPNNITDLWNLLGQTFFSLLQNVNTFNSSVNLNVINDRIRNSKIHVDSSEDQQRCSVGVTNFGKEYFEEPCSASNNPRDFFNTTRSTAMNSIADLEDPSLQNQRFGNEVCPTVQPPTPHPKVSNPNNADTVNSNPPVEIQKIILNKMFHAETAEQSKECLNHTCLIKKKPNEKTKKKCKSCRKIKRIAPNEQVNTVSAYSEKLRSKSIQTCAHITQFRNACETESHSEEHRSISLSAQRCPETLISSNLDNELFGTSDEEHLGDEADLNVDLPSDASTCDQAATDFPQHDVFCKPFMPKKRKEKNSVDTRIFHIKELKAVQNFQGDITGDQNTDSDNISAHSKRKRSMKSINKYSKIRICSKSYFDSEMPCPQKGETRIKLFTSCSPQETSTAKTNSNECLGSSFADIRTTGAVHNDIPVGLGVNEKMGVDNPLFRNRKKISEGDQMSATPSNEGSVIHLSSDKSAAIKCDQSHINVVHSAENIMKNDNQSDRLSNCKSNLYPQTSVLEMGDDTTKTKTSKEVIPIGNFSESKSELENTSKIPFNSSTPAIKMFPTSQANMNQPCEEKSSRCEAGVSTSDKRECSYSEWAIPASYSDQTANTNNSLDNISLDDSNERLEEILHRISDEFSTPERPVSAIPPFDSSQTEDSFSEEEPNMVKPAAPVKEKTKRKRECLTVTTVKRSERLKAKNLIQEAIKHTQLKIPGIVLGKYTKRKTDSKDVCANIIPDDTNPLPPHIGDPEEASKDYVNDEVVRAQEMGSERSRTSVSLQNSTSESEENTSNELVIDLPDEVKPAQKPVLPEEDENYHTSIKISQIEPTTSFNFDEFRTEAAQPLHFDVSPSSPAPSDREPETYHIPKQIPERISRKPKTNSLLSQIIANYNHEYHKKVMESRQEQDNSIMKQLQTTLASFVNASDESEDTVCVVEKMCNITNCEQLIAHSLILEVKTAPRPEKESSSPMPELYLGQKLRKILQLLEPLYVQLPNMRISLLMNVEKSIFSFTKDFISLDMTLNLTQFYLALIADVKAPTNPARLFICKCLFFYTKKAIPMIYEALCVYPSVLPHRDDATYDRSDALISTIQCLLMSTYYDTEKCDLKAKQMLYKLRNFYNYESLKPSRDDVIENLIAKLRAGRFKNVSYSFAVICKRTERKYIIKTILEERLLPLANEYYQTIGETAENDERIACVLECISYVIKPFPVDTDITTYINLYSRFLNAVDRQVVQEAAVSAILRTIRFGYVQCFTAIYNFQPKYEISNEFKIMLRSFVYKKNLGYLKKLESQIHVLTQ